MLATSKQLELVSARLTAWSTCSISAEKVCLLQAELVTAVQHAPEMVCARRLGKWKFGMVRPTSSLDPQNPVFNGQMMQY